MADRIVGSIKKSKTGGADYVDIRDDLKKGTYNLRNKKQAIDSIQAALEAGKLSEEYAEKLLADTEKLYPDFVRFNIIKIEKKEK